jgi:hypothetical protein
MGLTMREKQAVTRELTVEYKRATKERKGEILDSLVGLTEYNRSYAAWMLRQRSRYVVVGSGRVGDVKLTLVEDQRSPRNKWRRRPRVYGKAVLAAGVGDLWRDPRQTSCAVPDLGASLKIPRPPEGPLS